MAETQIRKKVKIRKKSSQKKLWLWLIPALLVVVGGALFLTLKGGNGNGGNASDGKEVVEQPSTDTASPTSETADVTTVQSADDATATAGTDKEGEVAQSAPAQSSTGSGTGIGSQQPSGSNTAGNQAASTAATQTATTTATGSQSATSTPQNALNQTSNSASQSSQQSSANPTGDVEKLAKEVIRGNYGVGLERQQLLGGRYREIQDRVNEIYLENGNSW
jgi:hypothetical protein